MNNDELPIREQLAGIADQKYPDIAREEEFDAFMSGVDATLALLESEKQKIVDDSTTVETSYCVFYRVSTGDAWYKSLHDYPTIEAVTAMWEEVIAEGNAKIYETVTTIAPSSIKTTEREL